MDILLGKQTQLDHLKEIVNKLTNFEGSFAFIENKPFNCNEISTTEGIKLLSKNLPSNGKYIYYFTLDKYVDAHNKFSQEIKKTKDIKFTKLNAKHKDSAYLYIGSSSSLKRRFEQHCGYSPDNTYALKLSKWLTDTSIAINFFYADVSDPDQIIMQNLEDGLWRFYKPLFGKLGANS